MPTLKTKIIGSNNYFSLISLHINGFNYPIKRYSLTDWLHKQDLTFCCLQETHIRGKERHYFRMKGWTTIFQSNGLQKQAGVAILIYNKIDFQPKVIKKEKEGSGHLPCQRREVVGRSSASDILFPGSCQD
jgi:exonuclease III